MTEMRECLSLSATVAAAASFDPQEEFAAAAAAGFFRAFASPRTANEGRLKERKKEGCCWVFYQKLSQQLIFQTSLKLTQN